MIASTWNLPAPPGFQGLRVDLPLTRYFRNLPHWRQDGATYFVTFRLHDSLPQAQLKALSMMKDEWERKHPEPRSEDDWQKITRECMQRAEDWLDQGMGCCVLREKPAADILVGALHFFDGQRHELGSYVVMPNHVHLLVRPLVPAQYELEDILQSWKTFSARRINALKGWKETLWQEESFDRIIRDEEHLYRSLQYIGRNPRNAGLKYGEYQIWVRPEWVALGWDFEK